jgi:hypothetical protein
VIYANRATRLVIMRARHGPHTLVAAALPLVTSIRREAVVGRLLYTGATVRHCHIAMVGRGEWGAPGLCMRPQFASRSMIWQMCLPISMAEGGVPKTTGFLVVRLLNWDGD